MTYTTCKHALDIFYLCTAGETILAGAFFCVTDAFILGETQKQRELMQSALATLATLGLIELKPHGIGKVWHVTDLGADIMKVARV